LLIAEGYWSFSVQDFRRVKVWEKSHHLTLRVYEATDRFPREELFGLTQQMRRSSSSIPTNIAEGCGRGSDADFARFLQIAMGSACELEYQLILACARKYIAEELHTSLEADLLEVKRMLTALLLKVRSSK
jgi:four helix bundle protein